MIGKTIGQYRIVGQLGRGGMGTVYKAVDETLDREVAIKILNPELVDTEAMRRFRVEATILAKLNHPEIATIYELFRSETDLLMVMEFVRGETLEKIFDRMGALPPDQAAYLIDRILSALEHAHRAGVVHRDIKPANVMVTDHGCVKIMDFGTARVRGADHVTVDGYMIGTPAYMPPEQVLGQPVDGRADLYSVGVVLYRLVTGKLPFKAATAIAVILQQISDPPTPLHEHREDLPKWCDSILQRALAKSPADRFQTAEEFREALGRGAGLVTTEFNRAFALPLAEVGVTTPMPPSELERFAVTSVPLGLLETQILAVPNSPAWSAPAPASEVPAAAAAEVRAEASGAVAAEAPWEAAAPAAPHAPDAAVAAALASSVPGTNRSAESPDDGSFIGRHMPLRSTLATVAGGLAVLAIVALQLPASGPDVSPVEPQREGSVDSVVAELPPLEIGVDQALPVVEVGVSPAPPGGTERADGTRTGSEDRVDQAPSSSEDRVAQAPPRLEDRAISAPSPEKLVSQAPPSTEVRAAQAPPGPQLRVTRTPPRLEDRVSQKPPSLEDRVRLAAAAPFEFEARALVDDGNRWRARKAQVLLAGGRISVQASDDLETLHSLPYERVLSISYSRGRDPLWSSPDGPTVVARSGGIDLGIFRGERHWVALRVNNPASRFVVLRLESEEQATQAISALEERTGRTAARVTQRKEGR